MSIAIATVAFLQGKAWAKSPTGDLRPLEVGSVLKSDEVLVTAKGAQVQLDFGNGNPVQIGGGLEVSMSRDFNAQSAAVADEAALDDASIQQALSVLERGGDLLEDLEETAAGDSSGGGSDGNTSFVRLSRLLETTDPLSFSYDFTGTEEPALIQTAGQYVNRAPTVADQSFAGEEDKPMTGQIIASDPDDTTLSWSLISGPTNGSILLDPATGRFTFTPNPEYHGSDSFVVTVTDSRGNTGTINVTLTIAPVNDAPISTNLTLTTDENISLAGQIIATDVDGDTLGYSVSTNPANGTVTLNTATGAFVYTPNANYNGSDSFVVTVSDGKGGTTTSAVTIGITPINDAPVTANLSLITNEDIAVNGQIIATDVDGDTLGYSISTDPANGTVTLNAATGAFVYTPNANYNGSDSFVVTVSDGKGGFATSMVTIGITPVNDVPVTADLSLTTNEDIAVSSQIIASDVDGDTLGYSVSTNPANGTVTLNTATGAFVYTPNANYHGSDSFVVTVSDGKGGTTTSTVTIGITPINDAPVTANLSLITDEDNAVNGQIIATDVDGDTLSYSVSTNPANGTVTLNAATGAFVYTPNTNYNGSDLFVVTVSDGKGGITTSTVTIGITPINDAPVTANLSLITNEDIAVNGQIIATDVDGDTLGYSVSTNPANGTVTLNAATGAFVYTPNANYHGSDSFVVTVGDGKGGITTSTVTIGITPINDAPVTANLSLITDEDKAVNGQVIATDVDGDSLGYSVSTNPANGTVTLNTATGGFVYTPNANYKGNDSFVVTVSDGKGGVATSTVTIGITPINDAPVTANLSLITDEDTPVNGEVIATDVDGDTLGYFVSTNPANGTVTLNAATGGFVYTPNANYNGNDSFIVTVSDGKGGITTSTVTIGITPVNDVPVTADLSLTTNEDTAVNGQVIATDVDGDTLGYSVSTNPANGVVTLNTATGAFVYTPNVNYHGSDSFIVTASDGKGGTTTSTVTIGITPINDAPVTANLSLITDENTAVNGQIIATDVDGDTLGYFVSTNPVNGTVTLNAATGGFVYTPNANYNGNDSFIVTVSDGKGGVATSTLTIGITPVNDVPVAANLSLITDEDKAVNGQIIATDVDGDTLGYSVSTNPTNGTVTLNTATGAFVYTPNANYHGSDSFVVTVSDGKGGATTSTATIGITPVNDVPVAANLLLITDEDIAVSGQVIASDVDGDSLGYSVSTNPTNGTVILNAATGAFVYTPNANYNGSDSFVVTVSDGKGGVATSTVTIGITPVNDAPVALEDSASVKQGATLTLTSAQLLANDSDIDGDTLTIINVGNPANGSVSLVGGNVQFVPAPGYNGPASFTYTISDGVGGTATATVNVTVIRNNTPPDAVDDPNVGSNAYSVAFGDASATDLWTNKDSKGLSVAIAGYNTKGVQVGLYTGTVDGNANAFGVTTSPRVGGEVPNQIEYDMATGTSESIVMRFNGNLNQATFGVSRLYPGEDGGEMGAWEAYYDGVAVASGMFKLTTGDKGSLNVNTGNLVFNSIKFVSLQTTDGTGDGGDYFLTSFQATGAATLNGPYIVQEGGTRVIGPTDVNRLVGNDTDADGDPLTVTHINGISIINGQTVALADGSSLTVNTDGSFSYATNSAFDYLTAGQVGTSSFTYTISDGMGGTDTATAVMTIVGSGPGLSTVGTSDNDYITGSLGKDTIIGAAGNDTLVGSLGADTFKWSLGDQGSAGAPAVDHVLDFSKAQGDRLHIADLLQGENSGNLTNYLHFTYSAADKQTTVHISSSGGYNAGYKAALTDQLITLHGVSVSGTDTAIINQLKNSGHLITD
jgi:hypothetical protein